MPQAAITLTCDEALYIADLLALAADAASNDDDVPDTFPDEARLAINLILSRTDDCHVDHPSCHRARDHWTGGRSAPLAARAPRRQEPTPRHRVPRPPPPR